MKRVFILGPGASVACGAPLMRDFIATAKRAQEGRLSEEFRLRAVSLVTDPQFTEWDWLAYAPSPIAMNTNRTKDLGKNPTRAAFGVMLRGEALTRTEAE